MSATDPLVTVWTALEHAGCDPHGNEHDFRARCPAHGGENRDALHVFQGVDRVVPWCFRGCPSPEVVEKLGLRWRDLFPPGHRKHRLRPRPRPAPKGKVDVILEGFALLGIPVRGMWVADRCPYCLRDGLWLRTDETGEIDTAECASGCNHDDVIAALKTYVALEEQTPAGHGRAAPPTRAHVRDSWWAQAPQEGGDDA